MIALYPIPVPPKVAGLEVETNAIGLPIHARVLHCDCDKGWVYVNDDFMPCPHCNQPWDTVHYDCPVPFPDLREIPS